MRVQASASGMSCPFFHDIILLMSLAVPYTPRGNKSINAKNAVMITLFRI